MGGSKVFGFCLFVVGGSQLGGASSPVLGVWEMIYPPTHLVGQRLLELPEGDAAALHLRPLLRLPPALLGGQFQDPPVGVAPARHLVCGCFG